MNLFPKTRLAFWEWAHDSAEWLAEWIESKKLLPQADVIAERILEHMRQDTETLTYGFYNSKAGAYNRSSPYWHGREPMIHMTEVAEWPWDNVTDPQVDRIDIYRPAWNEGTGVYEFKPIVVQEEANCQKRSSLHEGRIVEMKERLSSSPPFYLLAKPPLWRSESSFELLRHCRMGKRLEFPNGSQPPTPSLPKTTTE